MRDYFSLIRLRDGSQTLRWQGGEEYRKLSEDRHQKLLGLTHSPVERLFADALFIHFAVKTRACPKVFASQEEPDKIVSAGTGVIMPQRFLCGYRVDFAIEWHPCGYGSRLVVECDGHEFHEKTKDQAARDKRRDRDLLRAGWPVMRFTGSELHSNARECAEQAFQALNSQAGERQSAFDEGMKLEKAFHPEAAR